MASDEISIAQVADERASLLPVLSCAYLALLIAGYLFMRPDWVMRVGAEDSLSLPRRVFSVTNAASLSGFSSVLSVESFRPAGQWAFLILTIGGGLFSWIVGGTLVARVLRLPFREGQIAVAAVAMLAIAIVGGIAFAPPGELFQSVFRAISAVTNSGLWIGRGGSAFDWATMALWLPLVVLGSLGATVIVELWR